MIAFVGEHRELNPTQKQGHFFIGKHSILVVETLETALAKTA